MQWLKPICTQQRLLNFYIILYLYLSHMGLPSRKRGRKRAAGPRGKRSGHKPVHCDPEVKCEDRSHSGPEGTDSSIDQEHLEQLDQNEEQNNRKRQENGGVRNLLEVHHRPEASASQSVEGSEDEKDGRNLFYSRITLEKFPLNLM